MDASISDSRNIRTIVSENIRRLIDESGKSRQEICRELGIKYTTLCDWIKGLSSPRLETLDSLSGYFGIEIGDFFVDFNAPSDPVPRLLKYAKGVTMLDINTVKYMSDDQIKELLKKGFSFRHRSLEEYIKMSGMELKASGEIDWGNPAEGEIW